jgi:hypothetical protein
MKLNLQSKSATETRVLQYLEDNASDVLAEKINAGKKTLAGALDYAKGEARKLANGEGCICVEDATVFGWIIHFFEEEHIEEPKPVKPAVRVPAGVSKKTPPVQKAKTAKRGKRQLEQATMFEALFAEVAKP